MLAPNLNWSVTIFGSITWKDLFNIRRRVVLERHLVVAIGEVSRQTEREEDSLGVVDFGTVFALNAAITL